MAEREAEGLFCFEGFRRASDTYYFHFRTLLTYPAQDELAMVQDSVSNPMIGKMRMQFWRDAVKAMSDVRTF